MDATTLRKELHESVDQLLDKFLDSQDSRPSGPTFESIRRIGPTPAFSYAWPADYGTEEFRSGTAYGLPGIGGDAAAVVAWTTRYAWNRERDRAVVFYRAKPSDEVNRLYPWTEFVETDTGAYAAPIPNPKRPRAILREKDPLPEHLAGRNVARADQLFKSIRQGASLRLCVDQSDEAEMVRHGLWVAKLRGRV